MAGVDDIFPLPPFPAGHPTPKSRCRRCSAGWASVPMPITAPDDRVLRQMTSERSGRVGNAFISSIMSTAAAASKAVSIPNRYGSVCRNEEWIYCPPRSRGHGGLFSGTEVPFGVDIRSMPWKRQLHQGRYLHYRPLILICIRIAENDLF